MPFDRDPYRDIHKQMQRYVAQRGAPAAAKVVARTSYGTYNLQTIDGLSLNNVRNQTQTKYDPDQWVAIEQVGGDWLIVGISSHRGGE